MNLQHLCSAPHLTVSFDTWNNWLFVDWDGNLTLPAVQHACVELANCFLSHSYPRILNCNSQVTGVDWDVAGWLTQYFFPNLGLAGVEQIAWVYAPGVRGQNMAEDIRHRLPLELNIALFSDVEQAVSWLQHTRPEYTSSCALLPRPAKAEAKLVRLVQAFDELVHKEAAAAATE